jgi:hypothetical protein
VIGDLHTDKAVPRADRDRDRLARSARPAVPDAIAEKLTSRAASSPHGCLGPSTPPTNARATRARSARATVTLSRISGPAISAPAFPGRPAPGKSAGPAGRVYGNARSTHGRRGSQATWPPTLSLPVALPVGYGQCAESPASDLLWRLAAGDCLMGVSTRFHGGSTRRKSHLSRFAGLRLRCGNCRAAAGGCHRASLMIKRSEAAAAVRLGPAAPFRLTALVVSAGHMPEPVGQAGAAASFRLRNAGPGGPCRVSLEW